MDKLVVLKLDGNLKTQDFRISLKIGENNQFPWIDITETEKLPANPQLAAFEEEHWAKKYRPLGAPYRRQSQKYVRLIHRLQPNLKQNTIFISAGKGLSFRIKSKRIRNKSLLKECKESGEKLAVMLNDWLKCPEFLNVERLIRDNLNINEEARVLICTQDKHLQKLPWHRWDLFKSFPQVEPSLSKLNYIEAENPRKPLRKSKVRILGILGHSDGIDVAEDLKILNNLSPDAEVKFLVEPKRQEINDRLWEESWDIIFFAGHGETKDDKGVIYINPNDSLTVEELWYGLRKAVDGGLQLAIFNCCDGLGLARQLDDFQMIPQMILMRELVPDLVAQEFLKYFLTEFVRGKSLNAAAKSARQRLEGLEDRFPCASWLPVIWQHPAAIPPVWNDFLIAPAAASSIDLRPLDPIAKKPPVRVFSRLTAVMLASAWCTFGVMVARSLGLMQPWELAAFDRLMGQRQSESIDSRLLVVEVTDSDSDKYNYPQSDAIVARAIGKLQQFQPLAIGLNMHRYQAKPPGRQDLINLFAKNPDLITVCNYASGRKIFGAPSEFSQQQFRAQVGFSDLPHEEKYSGETNRMRRQSLSRHPNLASFDNNCKTPNSFSLILAERFLENQGIKISTTPNQEFKIGNVTFKRLAVRTGGYQNLDPEINQILLNYRASPKPALKVTLQEVLEGKINSDLVKGKIAIVGHTSEASRDDSDTPYGKMSGVWIQAHTISQILSAVIDKRPLLWVLPDWQGLQWGDAVFVWLAALTGGLLAWRGRSILVFFIASGAAIFVLYQGSLVILGFGGWMPLVPSVLALVGTGCMLFVCDRSIVRRAEQHPTKPREY